MNMNNVKSWLANLYYPILLILVISYGIFTTTALKNIPENSNVATIIAGIIGGFGTMVAVLISTIHTVKIQEENKEETRKIQVANKKDLLRKERKEFGDDIAVLVGRYITDIVTYKSENALHNFIFSQLLTARRNGDEEKQKELKDDLYKFRANKRISTECYFILNIKLKDINSAEHLLIKLDSIQKLLDTNLDTNDEDIKGEDIQELEDLTRKFINDYLNSVYFF